MPAHSVILVSICDFAVSDGELAQAVIALRTPPLISLQTPEKSGVHALLLQMFPAGQKVVAD